MNISMFRISVKEVEKVLKVFSLLKMKGIKSVNENGVSQRFKDVSTKEDYKIVYEEGLKNYDFDFLLDDQSYFQFEFCNELGNRNLRYAYYQNPNNYVKYADYVKDQLVMLDFDCDPIDVGSMFEEEYSQFLNEQEANLNYFTSRYDFDFRGYKPLIHPVSHLHIGHLNNIRIPLDKEISPLRFTLFIIRHVYRENWIKMIESDINYVKDLFLSCKNGESLLEEDIFIPLEKEELFLT